MKIVNKTSLTHGGPPGVISVLYSTNKLCSSGDTLTNIRAYLGQSTYWGKIRWITKEGEGVKSGHSAT